MANPVTHLEKTIAGEVQPVTHLEHVIAEYGGGNVYENLEAGTNILIEETADGKARISASGEVSSEDTVARAEIAAIKDGETLDSFGDVETALTDKADTSDIPTVPITAIQKNGTGITPVSGTVNITVPTSAADVSALPNTTKYAAALSLTINSSTFVMTGQLKDQNGDNLGTAQTIDLPLESVVVGGSYDSQTKKVVLTLQNGNTIEFSVADLVSGLQTELSASNKLNPAYINYDSTHRAVSDTEKSTWNGKQNALSTAQLAAANSGITSADVAQITTNKNNILLLEQLNGRKNVLQYDALETTNANGVTYTINDDYSITVTDNPSRSGTSYVILKLGSGYAFVDDYCNGNYKLYGCPSGGSESTYWIYVSAGNYYKADTGSGVILTTTSETGIRIILRLSGEYISSPITFKPMICRKELDSTYDAYAMTTGELTTAIRGLLANS